MRVLLKTSTVIDESLEQARFNTHLLWNKLSPHTWSEFLLQTSALTRIVLGLVDRTEPSELVPGPQSSRGHDMLGSVSCLYLHQLWHQSSSVVRSIHSDLRSSHLVRNNDSVDGTEVAYRLQHLTCSDNLKRSSSTPEWRILFIKQNHQGPLQWHANILFNHWRWVLEAAEWMSGMKSAWGGGQHIWINCYFSKNEMISMLYSRCCYLRWKRS